ncbi:UDP-N-acetylglucosamine 2-epimerase (non-hydrolyzing) [bacterium]|jgi:UDP-GlcNAc3NAcA epimerase|nr:UDP-N-acetylglucosamine 2-epimerase (non-hydrolyzing) [bacterium]
MEKQTHILTIVGARPQFVKAAVVSKAMQAHNIRETMVHTGQHYDPSMSDVFFEELEIPAPAHHLAIGSGGHGAQTGRMLERIEQVILDERPDRVLVYGDTNSTIAGALAASKLHIPVDHVEAGLRSFNRRMPEELNRVVTDHLSSMLFAPTTTAVANLAKEGITGDQVVLSGDVMFDATKAAVEIAARHSTVIERLSLIPGEYVLATIHRAENTDDHELLESIFRSLAEVSETFPVVLPLHPRTRKALSQANLLDFATERLRICEPLGYLDMTKLESSARVIATDSGGVQKEAFFHRVPCITIRTETEWVELVDLGWNRVCPPSSTNLCKCIQEAVPPSTDQVEPYGDGTAAQRIASRIASISSLEC